MLNTSISVLLRAALVIWQQSWKINCTCLSLLDDITFRPVKLCAVITSQNFREGVNNFLLIKSNTPVIYHSQRHKSKMVASGAPMVHVSL